MPVQLNQLVIGRKYFRINKQLGTRTIDAKFVGLFHGGFPTFEAGPLGGRISDNPEAYDFYLSENTLDISLGADLGILKEGVDIRLTTDVDSISYEEFVDQDECAIIINPMGNFTILPSMEKCFVYHVSSLQSWFDLENKVEPRTRIQLRQVDLRRFTYSMSD